jgi:hypothetical protein
VKRWQLAFRGLQLTAASSAHKHIAPSGKESFSQSKPNAGRAASDKNRVPADIQVCFTPRDYADS